MTPVRYLTLEDLLTLVDDLRVGPVRDLGLLESAAHRPTTTLWGAEAYDGLDLKAAALLESIVRNHTLPDANKRLGWLAIVVFFGLNGVDLDAPDDAAYELVIAVSTGQMPLEEAAEALAAWR
ncbi:MULTISPECIES: type II toxin-antitoxin system death-on-curing family toxin [Brachybacterium]|uniref:Alcohol dehydrogenase n=2 Tax=Brachybacterium TaxID=43668 RepID=A0A426SLX2_9MICO|nr:MULTISPECIES: Fic family protein [Brachybacterium]MCT1436492.1 Fic family protein [Brachybacterium paraconglomeratum]RRR19263.1 alcohol dehydrogenase [Brachybacterium paraconglomeratum]GLI29725.1 toxin Doc [Brachybacterium conglomeratum]GLK05406.1 toxin Doc [Brachybacterium conglomeratum]